MTSGFGFIACPAERSLAVHRSSPWDLRVVRAGRHCPKVYCIAPSPLVFFQVPFGSGRAGPGEVRRVDGGPFQIGFRQAERFPYLTCDEE